MAMQTYSAKKVLVLVNGIPVGGFKDKDMIEIDENSDGSELVKGPKGESSRYMINDDSGKIKVMLQQDSPANKLFQAFYKADKLSNGLLGSFSIMITDLNSASFYTGTDAFVKKHAPIKLGQGLNGMEWTIECGTLDFE